MCKSRRRMVLGVPIDSRGMRDTVHSICAFIDRYKGTEPARYVATVNSNFLNKSFGWGPTEVQHPELLRCLRRAEYVTPDGMPLVWITRLLGSSLGERVTGADLIDQLSEAAAERGFSIFLLGGRPGIADRAAEVLQQRYPRLRIAGITSPQVSTEGESIADAIEADERIVDEINQSGADLLFIALGNPKQEIWFQRVRHKLRVPASIGIGGAYEFVAGTVPRAPNWMQDVGLEWFWRMCMEPMRLWRRYSDDLVKISAMATPLLAYSVFARSWGAMGNSASPHLVDAQCLVFSRCFKEEHLDALEYRKLFPASTDSLIVLDFSQTRWLDPAALAWLMECLEYCVSTGQTVELQGVGVSLKSLFKLYRVWPWIEDLLAVSQTSSSVPRDPLVYEVDREGLATIKMRGILEGESVAACIQSLPLADLYDRDTTLDLSQCRHLDNFALSFVVRLASGLRSRGKCLNIKDPCKDIWLDLRAAKLEHLLTSTPESTPEA